MVDSRCDDQRRAPGSSTGDGLMQGTLALGVQVRDRLVHSMDPSILVFDEPSAGLDPRGRRQLIELLRGLSQTVIVASHDMRLVSEVLPRTVIMDGGSIVADGPTAQILAAEALLSRHGLERP